MGRTDKEIYRVIDNVNSYYRINSESKKELLLNKYPNAAAAYSLRLLDGYYRGPLVRVRRDDGVEVDVYPDYNNQLSLDSLVTNVPVHTTNDGIPDEDYTFQLSLSSLGEFVGATGYSSTVAATDATVCVWYDQSSTDGVPNANDASQSVADRQPLIVSSGVIVTENGKPAVQFDGSNDTMSASSSLTNQVTILLVYRRDTIAGNYILDGDNSTRLAVGDISLQGEFQLYVTSALKGLTEPLNQQNLGYVLANQTSSEIALNGGIATTGSSGNAVNTSIVYLGARLGASGFLNGKIQEVVYYDSNQSANRSDIEEDINSFYQIDGYTPTPKLIDLTQDLAVENGGTIADGTPAAAYSLRLLSSTYNGPLVRIRRTIDNTEVDVYPDSDGEFSIYSTIEDGGTELTTGVTGGSTDKTTLHEFLYGQDTDCMVVRWYDQASGNHATQDVATNQPKIYDSVTGVVTENGNPAILFSVDTTQRLGLSLVQPSADFMVSFLANVPLDKMPLGKNGGSVDSVQYRNSDTTIRLRYNATVDFTGGSNLCDSQVLLGIQRASGNYELYENSSSIGTSSTANTFAVDSIGNGYQAASSAYTGGAIQELVIWEDAQTSNRTNIESNINQHYNIY